MSEDITLLLNGRPIRVKPGTTIAAAILQAGEASRISITGAPRQPMCGMGVCYECRAEVDGLDHQRTCQMLCHEAMRVRTR